MLIQISKFEMFSMKKYEKKLIYEQYLSQQECLNLKKYQLSKLGPPDLISI